MCLLCILKPSAYWEQRDGKVHKSEKIYNWNGDSIFYILERFITQIHKYLNLQEVTPAILNDLVKRAYVHAPQMIDGKRTQEIDICYDLVGILPKALFQRNEETA